MISITKELRAWMDELDEDGYAAWFDDWMERLQNTADRIDAELAERYVALPLDADGLTIHVGDKLTDDATRKSEGEVHQLMLDSDGWYVGVSLGWGLPRNHGWHHQHPDSWERIIADACGGTASEQSLIDRCKALAGEGA